MHQRNIAHNVTCNCGEDEQTMAHILSRCPLGPQAEDSYQKDLTENDLAWFRTDAIRYGDDDA